MIDLFKDRVSQAFKNRLYPLFFSNRYFEDSESGMILRMKLTDQLIRDTLLPSENTSLAFREPKLLTVLISTQFGQVLRLPPFFVTLVHDADELQKSEDE